MRILLSGPPLKTIGGIQNYLILLINYLDNRGNEVDYFTQPINSKKNYLFYILFFSQFARFLIRINKKKPDIVQLNLSLLWASIIRDFLFLNISKINDVSTIIFFRGWRWEFFYIIKKNQYLRKLFIKNLKKADKIIVLSKDFRQALVELGLDEDTIFVTSTMVESNFYLSENKTFYKPYTILYCGYMIKYKGPFELLDSIPYVLEHEKNVNFILMGDGPELENLKNKTKELGVENYVSFTGYNSGDEKYDIFKKSHIFVLPSYTEGFSNVVLEAMAAGLPVVTTPVGGLKEAIKDGKNGFILKSNPPDPDEISHAILKIIKDPNMMKKMSEYNTNNAKEKYDVKVVTKEIEKIYLNIIKN